MNTTQDKHIKLFIAAIIIFQGIAPRATLYDMYLKYIFTLMFFWHCPKVLATPTGALTTVRGDYKVTGATQEISNMPRVRSQDSLGICFGFSSATIAQHYICKSNNIPNCANLPLDKEISPFSTVSWANTNSPSGGTPEAANHSNIQFGGVGLLALRNVQKSFLFHSDACFPFDQFANKYGNNVSATEAVIEKLQKFYNKNKGTTGTYCEDCILKEIENDLLVSRSGQELSTALGKETFGEFLFSVIFGRCREIIRHRPQPTLGYFPRKTDDSSVESFIQKTKDQLNNQRPVHVDGVCLEKNNNRCTSNHSVVISGYRRMCKSPTDCRDVFKVHNSWGQDWQNRNDGGWVDAKMLMQDVPKGGALSWYE